jgi:hypothetical protein
MAFTYNLATNLGVVRLLIPDRVEADAIFTDAEITAFLTAENDIVKLAAALALETIAADEALVQKVQRTLTEETDGAKLMNALMAKAREFRNQILTDGQAAVGASSIYAGPGRRALTPIPGHSLPSLNGYTHHTVVTRDVTVEACPDG